MIKLLISVLTPLMLLALILSPYTTASAKTSTEFSKAELQAIKQQYGQRHINLIDDYHKTIQNYTSLSREEQLLKVNGYLNTLLPGDDSVRNNQEEYWSTPKEFLAMGTGDCEDYVIIKYFTLIDLGFDENKLYFAIVRENSSINHHMVLLYMKSSGKPPLVLDNLSFRVMDLPSRYDLELMEFFNTTGRFKYDKNYQAMRLPGQNREFMKLRKRVRRGE
jgi:predicted transglutaminase-like cysteine proteinase